VGWVTSTLIIAKPVGIKNLKLEVLF